MYMYRYNTLERRYYWVELETIDHLNERWFDKDTHVGLDPPATAVSGQCSACGKVLRNQQEERVHFGYHGRAVQAPSEWEEWDPELGDEGMAFSMQAAVQRHVEHVLERCATLVPAEGGRVNQLVEAALRRARPRVQTRIGRRRPAHANDIVAALRSFGLGP